VRESKIESASVAYAKMRGWWTCKIKSASQNSLPDRLFGKKKPNGHAYLFFVEFKATGKEPTEIQLHKRDEMRDQGMRVYACDSRELFRTILEHENTLRMMAR
jgi:hypothetical protein